MKYILYILAIVALSGCQDQARNTRAEVELQTLKIAVESYRIKEGKFPSGSNQEIFAILQGKTSTTVYLEIPSSTLDDLGNMIDPWGSPYEFITQDDEMKIMSLGKNKIMDSSPTTDDIVVFTRTKK